MRKGTPTARRKVESLNDAGVRRTSDQIILFTRYPEPGKVKTRLIPALGPEGAADLHRKMTQRTLAEIMKLKSQRSIRVEVRYEGGGSKRMREWLGLGVHFRRQGKGELGARISRAFQHSFEAGMNRVVVVGSDSPALTAALIGRAFDSLHRNDLVIGPATDGGYYLIGLGHLVPQVFLDIPWGTSEVLLRTLAVAADIGLQPVLLDALDDVDRPEDLRVWGELQS